MTVYIILDIARKFIRSLRERLTRVWFFDSYTHAAAESVPNDVPPGPKTSFDV